MSVARAQREIDSAEFSEWAVYHNKEPFLIHREENMLSVIAAILANTHRQKGGKAWEPEDFLPNYKERKQETSDDMYLKLKAMFK